MYLDVNVDLTIIHQKLPQYQQSGKDVLYNGFFGYLPNPVNTTQAARSGFITGKEIANRFTANIENNVPTSKPY